MKPFVLAICALAFAGAANASPCSERVSALQSKFESTHPAGPVSAGTDADAAESTSAKLHHQPTEASVANAETKADAGAEQRAAHFQVEIEQAKAAADSGDERGCEAAANDAAKSLEP